MTGTMARRNASRAKPEDDQTLTTKQQATAMKKQSLRLRRMGDEAEEDNKAPDDGNNNDEDEKDRALDLSALLRALASGARSVQGLPVNDDFDFEASLPEFHSSLQDTQAALLETLLEFLEYQVDDTSSSIQDPLLWEACADACENLTEQIEAYLSSDSSTQAGQLYDTVLTSKSTFSRMVSNMADIPKPQNVYDFWKTDNGRATVFVPSLAAKPHSVAPLDLSTRPGHGLDTAKQSLGGTARVPDDVVAPAAHVPHPYQPEIEALEYSEEQLQVPHTKPPKIAAVETLEATWIDTPEELKKLGEALNQTKVFAVDLEAHNYRSFAGMTCLMQLSLRDQEGGPVHNYLVDTIVLKPFMQEALLEAFSDPTIVKLLHGADSDVVWLQQHFGLYLVNLFDTRRACDELQLRGSSYAYLLQHYVGIVADKTFQLADWRVRPLTDKLRQYAIQDTAYLLDIYEHLKYDIGRSKVTTMAAVLDMSKKVSLIRYGGEPFKPGNYEKLIGSGSGHKSKQRQMTATQKKVLQVLWDWRDAAARKFDESPVYVAPNSALVRLAFCCPTNVSTLQNLFHPMPPLILSEAPVIVEQIRGVTDAAAAVPATTPAAGVGASSSAFFKPKDSAKLDARRGMMSPVLGTQALYRQAGWMTQEESNANPSSTSEEERGGRTRRTLEINAANANYRSTTFSQHGMEENTSSTTKTTGPRASADAEQARESSARVRASIEKDKTIPLVLGIRSSTVIPGESIEEEEEDRRAPTTLENLEEKFSIPRSMREIYKISNRNRRLKKTGSPTPERGVTPTSEKEQKELERSEELLRQRGHLNSGYFDENLSPGKRAKRAGRDSEDSVPVEVPATSKVDDLEFMKNIGWVQNQHQADMLMDQRYGRKAATVAVEEDVSAGVAGVMPAAGNPNPFFAGAALQGGALTHGRDARHSRVARNGRAKSGRGGGKQERPKKDEGRSHVYRSKR